MNTTRRCSGYNITNTLQRIVPNIVEFQSEETPFTLIEDSQRLRHPRDELGADILRLVHWAELTDLIINLIKNSVSLVHIFDRSHSPSGE